MRRTATTLVWIAASGALVPALATQTPPDLSGTWTTEPAAVAAQPPGGRGARGGQGRGRAATGDMGSGWGPDITITQDSAHLTVEYPFFSRGDLQPPLRYVYALDGSETVNDITMGRGIQTERSRARWEGSTMVIDTTHAFRDPESGEPVPVLVTRRLTLESPTSLAVEVTRAGVLGGAPSSTRTVYRRR